jgi:hypothetical protein
MHKPNRQQTKKRLALDTRTVRSLQSDDIKLAAGGATVTTTTVTFSATLPTCTE